MFGWFFAYLFVAMKQNVTVVGFTLRQSKRGINRDSSAGDKSGMGDNVAHIENAEGIRDFSYTRPRMNVERES